MRQLTDAEREQLWEEVRREFPDDEMMQQIHYVRLIHYRQTVGLAPQERIQFFQHVEEDILVPA